MADDKLSGKAGLDTTDFKTGIAAMNRELRVLESGFRASAASLEDWSSDATGLESRIKSLTAQIEIQERKVAATRAEYERIVQTQGANSRAAQDLEIKLNKETETLGKMENELQQTEGALNEMQSGSADAGESIDELAQSTEEASGSVVSFGDVLEGTKQIAAGVVTVVAGLVATIGLLVGAIGGLVFSAADSAGALVDLSNKTGISVQNLQELQFIGDQVGVSLDTITGAQARLIRSMATAQDQTAKFNEELASGKNEDEINVGSMTQAFNELGVSVTDASGNLRDQQDVFNDVIDALGRIENPAQRDALAMEIFGKSAQELNPLIQEGSDGMADMAEQAHEMGAVMDDEAVAGLESFGDTMAALQDGIKGTLGTLAAQFLPVFQQVASALQDLFKSDEFKRGVAEFTELLQGAVAVAVDVLDKLLSGDIQGALADLFGDANAEGILNFFRSIQDFMQNVLIPFVTQHAEEIKAALVGIGVALAALGIVGLIASIVAALNPVSLTIAAIVAAVALLSAAWTGNWGGIRDTLTQIWQGVLQPIFTTLISWLQTNIPLAIQTVSAIWQGVFLPAIQTVWGFLSGTLFPLFQAIGQFLNAVFSLALRALAGIWQNVLLPPLRQVHSFLAANIFPIFQAVGNYIVQKLQPAISKLADFFNGKLNPALQGIATILGNVIDWLHEMTQALNNIELPDWMTPGSPTPWELGLIGINNAMQDLNEQLPILANQLNNALPNGMGVPGLGGSVNTTTQNDSFQFFAPVVIQGDTPSGSLGAGLKGRRY